MRSIIKRYIPSILTQKDKQKQKKMIERSRKMYKKNKYITRKKLDSFKSTTSKHILKAREIYKTNKISANKELAKETKCSLNSLKQIVKKGQGAYYSSGSRPNQTAHSWGNARLASSIFDQVVRSVPAASTRLVMLFLFAYRLFQLMASSTSSPSSSTLRINSIKQRRALSGLLAQADALMPCLAQYLLASS